MGVGAEPRRARPIGPPPALSAAPTPTGATTQGQALTAAPGTWANAPTSYAYGWERCGPSGAGCAPIAGATGSTYLLTGSDAGATIRSLVTATNVSGATTTASGPTAVIIPLPPVSAAPPAMVTGIDTNQLRYCISTTWQTGNQQAIHCDQGHGASGGPWLDDLQLSRG